MLTWEDDSLVERFFKDWKVFWFEPLPRCLVVKVISEYTPCSCCLYKLLMFVLASAAYTSIK